VPAPAAQLSAEKDNEGGVHQEASSGDVDFGQ
jgi:hypothetical protein